MCILKCDIYNECKRFYDFYVQKSLERDRSRVIALSVSGHLSSMESVVYTPMYCIGTHLILNEQINTLCDISDYICSRFHLPQTSMV